jgi:glutathione synthase/RimK-type ligase-like ATP-grasp enzyme
MGFEGKLFDDQFNVLAPQFSLLDMSLEAVIWDDDTVVWSDYKAVLTLCAWDYVNDVRKFFTLLYSLKIRGIHIINSVEDIHRNHDKIYMLNFEFFAPTIPTFWMTQITVGDVMLSFKILRTDHVVVKKRITSGSKDQIIVSKSVIELFDPTTVLLEEDGMIQPFMKSIVTEGEYSVVQIGGETTHAFIKRPDIGDYRVQEAYGGTSEKIDETPELKAAIHAVRIGLKRIPPIARYDFVRGPCGKLYLIELEAIKPYLFPQHGPIVGLRLAQLVDRALS